MATTTSRVYDQAGRVTATYRGGYVTTGSFTSGGRSCQVAGPDAGGYTCEPVAFDWADTTGGTAVALGDDAVSAAVAMPFAFSWYGQAKASVTIGSNGIVCFTAAGCQTAAPAAPPNTAAPNDLLACFWEDLDPSAAGIVRYQTVGSSPNRRLVVEFNAVPHYGSTAGNTFQFQLTEAGEARCMFSSVASGGLAVATTVVGTENATGSAGLRYRSGAVNESSTGVRFGPGGSPTPGATLLTKLSYDTAGRLASLIEWASQSPYRTTTFGYDATGNLTTVTRPGAAFETTSTYDGARGWLTGISHNDVAGVLASTWSYTRRPSGAIASEATGGRTRAFTYDGAGRLVRASDQTTSATPVTRDYAYDANTNRCANASACDASFTYDNADRLTASPQASAYSYDAHGNLTSAVVVGNGNETIGYDANDHAVEINDGTSRIEETLSPSGRVLRRKVTDVASGAVNENVQFGYDGPGDSPSYAVDGTITSYLQGPGGLLLSSRLGLPSYPLANAHGDIVASTDVACVIMLTPTTDEFGRGNPAPDRLGWLGSHQRYSTGGVLKLVRMGVRLYDPTLGRFLQVDPVEGGSSNDYDYVSGDPVNELDLGGLCRSKGEETTFWSRRKCNVRHAVGRVTVGERAGGECSWSPEGIPGVYNFHRSCVRHDQCYRRVRDGNPTWNKTSCDFQFLLDTQRHCSGRRSERACLSVAERYYEEVRDRGRAQPRRP